MMRSRFSGLAKNIFAARKIVDGPLINQKLFGLGPLSIFPNKVRREPSVRYNSKCGGGGGGGGKSATAGKTIKCKAAVKYEQDKPFVIEEVDVAPPKKGEVRIKLLASGVCHTDVYNFGDFVNPGKFPVIRGHEGGGVVESVGEGVTHLKPGDHCIPIFMPLCQNCKFCKNPKTNLCSSLNHSQGFGVMPDGTSRFSLNGKKIHHFMGTSTFSNYTVCAGVSVAKINEKAALDKVCLLGCGISTGYGGALVDGKVTKGSTCGVWGLGAVGLACVMGCRKAGAKRIFGIDTNSAKCELSRKFGVTDFVNPNEIPSDKCPLSNYLMELTDGGFDFSFECVGKADIMQTALESTHFGWGRSVIVGVDPSGAEIKTLPWQLLIGREWTGSAFGGYKSLIDIPKLVDEYVAGDLMVDEFITHVMSIDCINDAFELMLTGKSIHSVLYFDK